jgi:alpha-D-xyloside xylohydrolase
MRALVMDFPDDRKALGITDEFMFGPALLVNPVTEAGAVTRGVYLPAQANWYDFWTGTLLKGGQLTNAAAPLDTIPLYVRAGSIVPMGPELQYTGEKPADPVELRIYRGADGTFTLYEDEGDGYTYEKGVYSTITFHWDDATHELTLGARHGSYPGMLPERTFKVVVVGSGRGVGEGVTATPDKLVRYDGNAQTVTVTTP